MDNLWLSRDDSDAVGSALLPKLEKTRKAVTDIMYEVCARVQTSREIDPRPSVH